MNNNFENYQEELLRHRQYFHMHPELGLEEKETAAYIRKRLEELGFEIIPVAPTGMIARASKAEKKKKDSCSAAEMGRASHRRKNWASLCFGKSWLYACLRT